MVKKILAIAVLAVCIAASSASLFAEEWSFSSSKEQPWKNLDAYETPFAAVFSIAPYKSAETFPGSYLAPFVPIQMDQFVISLLDVANEDIIFENGQAPDPPLFQLNTGIRTESYLEDPQSLFMDELFGRSSDSSKTISSVIFVGVGFNFNSLYLKGNAYVGRPLETLSNKIQNSQSSELIKNQGVDTDAYGFEASAGYQLSNIIALGAGFGKMMGKNQETDQTEEVYAVYAQAILAVAPGVQVKPEIGKVDRIKEKTDTEEIDQSFYAGAIWEINF